MKVEELRNKFKKVSGIEHINSQGEPDIDYVEWLEEQLLKEDSANVSDQELRDNNKAILKDKLTILLERYSCNDPDIVAEHIIALFPSPK